MKDGIVDRTGFRCLSSLRPRKVSRFSIIASTVFPIIDRAMTDAPSNQNVLFSTSLPDSGCDRTVDVGSDDSKASCISSQTSDVLAYRIGGMPRKPAPDGPPGSAHGIGEFRAVAVRSAVRTEISGRDRGVTSAPA